MITGKGSFTLPNLKSGKALYAERRKLVTPVRCNRGAFSKKFFDEKI